MRLGMRGKAPVPASFDQQGGQSGKIHFIESIYLQNVQLWGSGEEIGDACAPLGLRPTGRPDLHLGGRF